MSEDKPFDRRLRRQRRDRAARLFAGADYLHRRAGGELLERLDLVTRRFDEALVIGCADHALIETLRGRGLKVACADAGFRFARGAGGIQCDEDRLAFADASMDLVVSVGVLDSVNDLPGALTLVRRVLRPDGLFLAAFAGAGSLPRLRAAMLAADDLAGGAAARIHPQIDVRAAGDLLARAGFALPVADAESVEVRFPRLAGLVADLRAMAGTSLLPGGARRPLGRIAAAVAGAHFERDAGESGRTGELFEIVHLSGWAPSPDQPKPARRGSGSASLAAALRDRAG